MILTKAEVFWFGLTTQPIKNPSKHHTRFYKGLRRSMVDVEPLSIDRRQKSHKQG